MEWTDESWGGAEGLLSGAGPAVEMVSGQRPEGGAQGSVAGGVSLGWGGRLERPASKVLPQLQRLADSPG